MCIFKSQKKFLYQPRSCKYNQTSQGNKTILIVTIFYIVIVNENNDNLFPYLRIQIHKEAYEDYQSRANQKQNGVSDVAAVPSAKKHSDSLVSTHFSHMLNLPRTETEEGLGEKYPRDHPRQVEFNEVLTRAIVLDSLPFQTVDRSGFKTLIQFLDKHLTIPVRNTVVARIEKKYAQVSPNSPDCFISVISDRFSISYFPLPSQKVVASRQLTLRIAMSMGTRFHLIIDIWTNPQKSSVLGIEVQFIKEWKLCRFLLGFLAFDVSHSSDNIKHRVFDHIRSTYDINEDQVIFY